MIQVSPDQTGVEPRTGLVHRQLDEVRAAVALLTWLPAADRPGGPSGARAFGIVGALIGAAGFIPLVLLGASVPTASAILAVALMATLTGAIHLDGLADTADAVLAFGPDAAERARQDPALGAGGAIALILVLGLEVAALTQLVTGPGPIVAGVTCVVAGAMSRTVAVILARITRSRMTVGGLGASYARRVTHTDTTIAAGCGMALVVGGIAIGNPAFGVAALVGFIGGMVSGLALVRARGRSDGDMLGASVELAFAAALLAAAVLHGSSNA